MQINIVASAGEAAEAMGDHARSVRWTRFSQAAAGRQGLQSDTTELALLNQLINRLKSAMGPTPSKRPAGRPRCSTPPPHWQRWRRGWPSRAAVNRPPSRTPRPPSAQVDSGPRADIVHGPLRLGPAGIGWLNLIFGPPTRHSNEPTAPTVVEEATDGCRLPAVSAINGPPQTQPPRLSRAGFPPVTPLFRACCGRTPNDNPTLPASTAMRCS